jgi:hypothetical protein
MGGWGGALHLLVKMTDIICFIAQFLKKDSILLNFIAIVSVQLEEYANGIFKIEKNYSNPSKDGRDSGLNMELSLSAVI